LQTITGVSHLEAQKHADFVRKAYLDDISHIKPEKEEKNLEGQKSTGKIDTSTAISTSEERQAGIVEGLMKEGAYDIAKQFIDFVKAKKKEKAEEKS
jgi:hypothetical protein